MNFTPKIHSILVHALEQARFFLRIGDTLEDDMEHMHQIHAWIEPHVSHMKNEDQQAFVPSRMESIQSNVAVVTKIEERNKDTKHKMKASADIRAKWLKEERNEGQEQAAIKIQQTT